MDFIVTANEPVSPDGHAIRKVLLQDPDYGGTWTYNLSLGPTPDQTTLKITEDGFIKSPFYRFAMMHILGPTSNLDTYLKDIQKKAAKG